MLCIVYDKNKIYNVINQSVFFGLPMVTSVNPSQVAAIDRGGICRERFLW